MAYQLNIKHGRLEVSKVTSFIKQESVFLVDAVKQSSGNINNGNITKRFFKSLEKTAQITNVDEILIRRFATVLQAFGKLYEWC